MAACAHPPDRARLLLRGSDRVTGEPFTVVRCEACGLARTDPCPADDAWDRYYPAAYYGRAGARRFPWPVEAAQALLYGGRARRVEQLTGGPGRVLDVGCGPGALLRAFQRRGWEVQGTELSEASAARARAAGIPVQVGPVGSWPWPDGSFDAAVLWHVLEHVAEPAELLGEVARRLRAGGVLLLGLPDFESPEARWAGAGWFHLDLPRHQVHLSPASAAPLLAAAGLRPLRTTSLAPEYDAFSFVQSVENALGLPPYLLYDLLRAPEARLRARPARWYQAAAAVTLAAPLGLVALPLTLALGLAGRGATFTVLAVREEPG